jgi:biopolymer transport protein ExbD
MDGRPHLQLIYGSSSTVMLYLSVLLLVTVIGIYPAPTGPHLAAAATATPVRPGPVTIGVDERGMFYLDNRVVADSLFAGSLRHALSIHPEHAGTIYLVAERYALQYHVDRALSIASSVGVRRVELIVECPHGRESLRRRCAAGPSGPPNPSRR